MNNIINLKKTIYVYHKDWENQILIENNSLTRLDSNGISMSTCTDFCKNEHFLSQISSPTPTIWRIAILDKICGIQ